MNAHQSNSPELDHLNGLFDQIVGAIYEVSNTLGAGFLERVYERALVRELELRGLRAASQCRFSVSYKGRCVGEYLADIVVVEDCLIVELKCAERLCNEHMAQCINYLKVSNLKLALLVNFQKPRVEWKRVVLGL